MRAPALVGIGALASGIGCSSAAQLDGAPSETTQSVIGGRPVAVGEFSAVMMLDIGCTGVLVHHRHLVTAAHCIENSRPVFATGHHDLEVIFGEDSALSVVPPADAEVLPISACSSHPRHRETGFDVAVCHLEQGSSSVLPHLAATPPPVAGEVTLVGYGFDSVAGTAGRKRTVASSIEGISAPSAGGELMIGTPDAGTCRGDSGSPAFSWAAGAQTGAPTLVGILSGGEPGKCGVGWYVNVAAIAPWLRGELSVEQRSNAPAGGCSLAGAFSRDESSLVAAFGASAWLVARRRRRAGQ